VALGPLYILVMDMLTRTSLTIWPLWEEADSGGPGFTGTGDTDCTGSSESWLAGMKGLDFTVTVNQHLLEYRCYE